MLIPGIYSPSAKMRTLTFVFYGKGEIHILHAEYKELKHLYAGLIGMTLPKRMRPSTLEGLAEFSRKVIPSCMENNLHNLSKVLDANLSKGL
jgi:hypothetical protein